MNLYNIQPVLQFNISPYTNNTSKELRHTVTQMTEWLIHTFDFICIANSITWRDNFLSIASHQILFVLFFSFFYVLFYLLFKILPLLFQILFREIKYFVTGE
jgi:hypothetical protein